MYFQKLNRSLRALLLPLGMTLSFGISAHAVAGAQSFEIDLTGREGVIDRGVALNIRQEMRYDGAVASRFNEKLGTGAILSSVRVDLKRIGPRHQGRSLSLMADGRLVGEVIMDGMRSAYTIMVNRPFKMERDIVLGLRADVRVNVDALNVLVNRYAVNPKINDQLEYTNFGFLSKISRLRGELNITTPFSFQANSRRSIFEPVTFTQLIVKARATRRNSQVRVMINGLPVGPTCIIRSRVETKCIMDINSAMLNRAGASSHVMGQRHNDIKGVQLEVTEPIEISLAAIDMDFVSRRVLPRRPAPRRVPRRSGRRL